ncbi:MAG: UbiA family prenyltransferase [Planctomycetota bacterium]
MSTALPYLRLLRAGTLFSPAADVIAGHCIASASIPWSFDLCRAVAASVCLYAAGMVLNDHADRRLDARLRPERPLPRGEIKPPLALGLGLMLVVVCLVITPVPAHHGVMALLVLAYDYALKKVIWLGAVVMGILRAMNLAAGSLLAVGSDHFLREDTLLYAAVAYALYTVAVTLLGALEDNPRNPKAIRGLVCVPPLVVFLALLAMPRPWPAAGIAFVLVLTWFARYRHQEWDRAEVRAAMTWLLLGTMVYTSLLCLAADHAWAALLVVLMVLPARHIARSIALT